MRRQTLIITLVALLLAAPWLAPQSGAEPPFTMSYQGRLFHNDAPYTGNADFKFVLVVEEVETLWSNDESSTTGNEPIASVPIYVENGIFTVLLGEPGVMIPLAPWFFDEAPVPMLRIWVNTGSGFEQLDDVPVASSLYSICAESANRSIGNFLVDGEMHTLGGIRFPDDSVQMTASTGGGSDNDWTVVGNDMYATPSGFVGIGTTNPQHALDVWGIAQITLPTGSFQFSTPGGWPGMIMYSYNGNRRDLIVDDNGLRLLTGSSSSPPGGSNGITIRETGFVGIGTQIPDGMLQVAGTATAFKLRVRSGAQYVVEAQDVGGAGVISLAGPGGTSTNLGISLQGDTGAGGGQATFYNDSGNYGLQINGDMGSGEGQIDIYDGSGSVSVQIVGEDSGGDGRVITDVLEITGGADLSEQFDVAGRADPGMTVSIDPANPGRLAVSRSAYDRKVAGIVSGAGGVKPGMLMSQKGSVADGELPVALSGRVWTLCDADGGAIEPGDLLTTSSTAGHAMKASDQGRSHGAILGKAMTALESGRGLVLVLVNLQ